MGLALLLAACRGGGPAEPSASAAVAASGADASEPIGPMPVPVPANAASALQGQADIGTVPASVLKELQHAKVPLDAVSLLVAPADGGAPTLVHNGAVPRNPASVMKLVTTAAALELLGPEYRWHTRIWTDGVLRDGTLQGNLYVQGSGDPKLVVERLWLLLQPLRDAGIRHISGDLVLDRSAFTVQAGDPGAFDGAEQAAYNVLPDALLLNFQVATVHIRPDAGQKLAHVALEPPLAGENVPATVALGQGACEPWLNAMASATVRARRITLPDKPYPESCGSQHWRAAYPEPGQFAGKALLGVWQTLGGSLGGQVREAPVPPAVRSRPPLSDLASPTLAEVVHDINKFSNNVMARHVFLTLGREEAGQGDLVHSQQALQQWWSKRMAGAPAPQVENGAGLSRTDHISAEALGTLLQRIWQSPVMPEWMASMPIAGVDGTLRRVRTAARGRAHLKTGTLRDAVTLAGYVLDSHGRHYVLVAMASGPYAGSARPALHALVDWVAAQ